MKLLKLFIRLVVLAQFLLYADSISVGRRLLDTGYNNNQKASYLHDIKRTVGGVNYEPTLFLTSLANYSSGLLYVALPFLILSGIFFLIHLSMCACLWIYRECRDSSGESVARNTRIFLRGALITTSVFVLIPAIVGVVGHYEFRGNLNTLGNIILNSTNNEGNRAISVYTRLYAIDPSDTNTTIAENGGTTIVTVGNDIISKGQSSSSYLTSNVVYMDAYIGVTAAMIFLCVILGICSGIFPKRPLILTLAFTLIIPMVLTWIAAALYIGVSTADADLCYDIEGYTIQQRLLDRQATNYSSDCNYGGIDSIMRVVKIYHYEIFTGLTQEIMQKQNSSDPNYNSTMTTLNQVQSDLNSMLFGQYIEDSLNPIGSDTCGNWLNSGLEAWGPFVVSAIFQFILTIFAFISSQKFLPEGYV